MLHAGKNYQMADLDVIRGVLLSKITNTFHIINTDQYRIKLYMNKEE